MKNEEIIERLAKVIERELEHGEHDDKVIVRAVLRELAECGNSQEMDLAAACAVRTLEPAEYDAAFRAALRSLGGE